MAERHAVKGDSSLDTAAKAFGSLLFGDEGQETPEVVPKAQVSTDDDLEETTPPATSEDEAASEGDDEQTQLESTTKKKVKDVESQEEVEVEEEEAELGYLRLQDYTRKTQLAATLRKQAEADLEEARTVREEYSAKLDEASQWLDSAMPKEPDWASLRTKLSAEQYAQTHAQWQAYSTAKEQIDAEKAVVQQAQKADFERQAKAHREREKELLETAIPTWKDPSVAQKGLTELVNWLRQSGYEDDQIDMISDHRLIVHLVNAMNFEKARTGKPRPNVVPRSSKTVPPGTATSTNKPVTEKSRDLARLQKSGKLSDAARAFMHFVE